MAEPIGDDPGGVVSRRSTKRRRRHLHELVLIVRPPGRPADIRVFAEDEMEEAATYAAQFDTSIERLA